MKVIQDDKKTDPDLFETYLKKVKHIQALFIDNYSNVSHIITQANEMLPITPCEIPFNRDYIQVFSSFQISDVKEGMSVEWLKNRKKVSGKVVKTPDINDKKVFVIQVGTTKTTRPLFKNLCFDEHCAILPTFSEAETYLTKYKTICSPITSIVVSENDMIESLLLSNGNYLGLAKSKYNKTTMKKYRKIESPHNLVTLERQLSSMDAGFNDCDKFITYFKYETYITDQHDYTNRTQRFPFPIYFTPQIHRKTFLNITENHDI